jgi:7,8-dihydro-6-hydroxymethylpterin dimethyltransferase
MAGPRLDATTYLGQSRGVCRTCGEAIDVRYVAEGGRVFLERLCPEHGRAATLVAEDLGGYLEAMAVPPACRPPRARVRPRTAECPGSCGPCTFHAQRCNLPVLSITNACQLRCPICFTYNRADRTYFMSPEEFSREIDFIVEATGGVDLVDLTGGEPTLHPRLFELLAIARRPEIGRVVLNSNGLRLADDADFARRLADEGVYVALSLDALDPALCTRIHGRDISGEKRRALENLERAGVQTTLLMVLAAGVNETEGPLLLDLLLGKEFVRSLCIQTMTYTGQGGGGFLPRAHLPVDGVERRIEQWSGGRIRRSSFVPLPTAHPLCYGVNYLLQDGEGAPHSLSDLLGREALLGTLADGYLPHAGHELEDELRLAIDRLWSRGESPALLGVAKDLLRRLYPTGGSLSAHERQRLAERSVKTIYVHAHMDEDTYEVGRAVRCPDQVPVGGERLISACNYNLFYRKRDDRFWVEPR